MRDVAESYLRALEQSGQVCGPTRFAWCRGKLLAYAYLARPNSLAPKFHRDWAKRELAAAVAAFGRRPDCRVLQDDVPTRFRSWRNSKSLYLFTHAFDEDSPICCGDTGSPIPPYLLPANRVSSQGLDLWASAYRDHHRIWFDCAALEIPAYRELVDARSEPATSGRALCADIEKATSKPTYY